MSIILLVVLLMLLVGALPGWGYHRMGYGPSGAAGLVLLILIVLILAGRV